MKNGRLGNSRNDSRPPRLPKDEKKREREIFIREWAKNNGCSIGVARAYWSDQESRNE
ncbi:MAG: hypothetical protein LBH43_18105 [Treponema sp.]|jgi:hypothetical protein|nr:hypothetical protein [Treponema sp.]